MFVLYNLISGYGNVLTSRERLQMLLIVTLHICGKELARKPCDPNTDVTISETLKVFLSSKLPKINCLKYQMRCLKVYETFEKKDVWKENRDLPLHTSSLTDDPYNHRSISITSVVSKIIERHVHVHYHIYKHQSKYNLLYDYQSGFHPRYSCKAVLLKPLTLG